MQLKWKMKSCGRGYSCETAGVISTGIERLCYVFLVKKEETEGRRDLGIWWLSLLFKEKYKEGKYHWLRFSGQYW